MCLYYIAAYHKMQPINLSQTDTDIHVGLHVSLVVVFGEFRFHEEMAVFFTC